MQCSVSAHHLPTNHLQCLLYEQTTSTNNSGAILLQVLQSALRKKLSIFLSCHSDQQILLPNKGHVSLSLKRPFSSNSAQMF